MPDTTVKTTMHMYSRLSRCGTAKGSSTRLFRVGPIKVKACKSFLFTDGPLKVENTLVNMSGLVKSVTAMVTECLERIKLP